MYLKHKSFGCLGPFTHKIVPRNLIDFSSKLNEFVQLKRCAMTQKQLQKLMRMHVSLLRFSQIFILFIYTSPIEDTITIVFTLSLKWKQLKQCIASFLLRFYLKYVRAISSFVQNNKVACQCSQLQLIYCFLRSSQVSQNVYAQRRYIQCCCAISLYFAQCLCIIIDCPNVWTNNVGSSNNHISRGITLIQIPW